jgi:hypothetical protein
VKADEDLLREAKLALEWLDNILLRLPLPVLPKILDQMPNNWGGRDAIRKAIAKAEADGRGCPKCGAPLRNCVLGAPDRHCDACGTVVPIYERRAP